jgi:hypothetical protein
MKDKSFINQEYHEIFKGTDCELLSCDRNERIHDLPTEYPCEYGNNKKWGTKEKERRRFVALKYKLEGSCLIVPVKISTIVMTPTCYLRYGSRKKLDVVRISKLHEHSNPSRITSKCGNSLKLKYKKAHSEGGNKNDLNLYKLIKWNKAIIISFLTIFNHGKCCKIISLEIKAASIEL